MKSWRVISRRFLILVLLLGVAGSLHTIQRVHAAGTLSVDPQANPLAPEGSQVSVNVRVDSMDQFNAWKIVIQTNSTALNGTSIDYSTQSIIPPGDNFLPAVTCVNNHGTNCQAGVDGPGIIHSEGTFYGSTPPPTTITGVIFTINYAAGPYVFSSIHFVVKDIINGGCSCSVTHDSVDGTYGTLTAPAISFTVRDQSLFATPGTSVNTTLSISSINEFSGQVDIAYQPNPAATGVSVTFNSTSVALNNSTGFVQATIFSSQSTAPQGYLLNITATGPRVFQYVLLQLNVQNPGGFTIDVSPGLLKLPQASNGSVMVIVKPPRQNSVQEFSGNVTLSVVAVNATATLGRTLFYLGPGKTVTTTLTISVPSSFYAYRYLINITGRGRSADNRDVNATAQLVVTPPPYDLSPVVTPTILTIRAGQSGYATLSISGVNYFIGSVYASSTMSGGTARYSANTTTPRIDLGKPFSFSLNITIDPSTPPGNYIVLLTAYSGTGIARSITESVTVEAGSHRVTQLPTTILGLTVPVYFGILGGLAAIFVLMTALVYRKNRLDRDEGWENEP
ncbi:hypothetical protein J2P12_02515 [Candidatus Bathyarchaeota archaeon]|nr:hypothetical protein [Candidatus Bathyarchaeota archaeon]